MMPPYPFFGFPPFRRPYSYIPPYNNVHNLHFNSTNNKQSPCSPNISQKSIQGNFNNCSSNIKNNNLIDGENDYDECFEIFGFKLHFDDLLILTLLFFLYQEEVKDTYLFMALILLLLS